MWNRPGARSSPARPGAARITKFDPDKLSVRFACEVKGFDPLRYMDRKEAQAVRSLRPVRPGRGPSGDDPGGARRQGAVARAHRRGHRQRHRRHADVRGQLHAPTSSRARTGSPRSSSRCSSPTSPRAWSPCATARRARTTPPCRPAPRRRTRSAKPTVRSSTGMADVMITGGAEATVTAARIGGFANMKALSKRNDSPETASRPFDRDRDGFVLGEGGGDRGPRELEHAQSARRAHPRRVLGYGASADAYHLTAPARARRGRPARHAGAHRGRPTSTSTTSATSTRTARPRHAGRCRRDRGHQGRVRRAGAQAGVRARPSR